MVPIPNANKLRKNKTDHKTGGLSSVTAKGITINTNLNKYSKLSKFSKNFILLVKLNLPWIYMKDFYLEAKKIIS